jgi:hypothetical protein
MRLGARRLRERDLAFGALAQLSFVGCVLSLWESSVKEKLAPPRLRSIYPLK